MRQADAAAWKGNIVPLLETGPIEAGLGCGDDSILDVGRRLAALPTR